MGRRTSGRLRRRKQKGIVVSPADQSSQPQPELIAQAIRRGWAVPEGTKPGLIDELVAIVLDTEMSAKQKVSAFNALRLADRSQWEQDHPEEAGRAHGSTTVGVSVQANILASTFIRELLESEHALNGDSAEGRLP
jgi:hypothetical protein